MNRRAMNRSAARKRKKLTPKQRVLRKYLSAKAVKSKNGWCIHRFPKGRGLVIPLDNCWMRTESEAWMRADWRLP